MSDISSWSDDQKLILYALAITNTCRNVSSCRECPFCDKKDDIGSATNISDICVLNRDNISNWDLNDTIKKYFD